MKTILLTGGLGFIGSHLAVTLLNSNYNVIILDDLSNSKKEVIFRIRKLSKKPFVFIKGSILNEQLLLKIFKEYSIYCVIHLAGLKSVKESCEKPHKYYKVNVSGSLTLFKIMKDSKVKNLVFSSSATVYGVPEFLPIDEGFLRSYTNPYGKSKLTVEFILEDISKYLEGWNIVSLRYFNPVGAHPSGLLGEDSKSLPTNLMPLIIRAAKDPTETLNVFGFDYPTKDGSAVRDYIHIMDLVDGHLSALDYIEKQVNSVGFIPINLGTGVGFSVLELIDCFNYSNNKTLKYSLLSRREGDISECYACNFKAKHLLNWTPQRTLREMCKDSWNYNYANKLL